MGKIKYAGDIEATGGLLRGNGMQFPAVQVPSADPNAFDDYGEGTWTPTPSGLTVVNGTGGVTYGGTYTKIGRLVFITIVIIPSGTATTAATAGATYFDGLPFAVAQIAGGAWSDGNASSLGTEIVALGRLYAPTWSARNVQVYGSGTYVTAT